MLIFLYFFVFLNYLKIGATRRNRLYKCQKLKEKLEKKTWWVDLPCRGAISNLYPF